MDYSEVRKLVKLVEASEIQELELEQDGVRIRVSKPVPVKEQIITTVAGGNAAAPVVAQPAQTAAPAAEAPVEKPSRNYHEVKSPMVGTFYRSPAPDADPYVQVGDVVKPGQTLCIVEAMKLMNEIESDVSGRIVEILTENADAVEFGQAMFLVDPQG